MQNLTTHTVLRLNGNFQRLGWCSPQEAFTALMGENPDGSPPALSLDIHYPYDDYGMPLLDKMEYFDTLEWEYWMIADPRKGDLDKVIHTSKRIIRIPTVIMCPRFRKVVKVTEKSSPSGIRERDENTCQYTGVLLDKKTFSIDHVVPRSRGGKNTWDNMVTCHKDLNSRKGNKLNHEMGLKLVRPIPPPKTVLLSSTVKGNYHPDHEHFP